MQAPVIDWGFVATQGIFAVLFVWLLYGTRKESADREKEYRSTITLLQETFHKREAEYKQTIHDLQDTTGERERNLMDFLDKANDNHTKITKALEKLEGRIETIDRRIESLLAQNRYKGDE